MLTRVYIELRNISIFLFLLSGSVVFSQDEVRILPLGNSITRGDMCLNGDISGCVNLADPEAIGYRKRLDSLMNDAGYNIDLVGNAQYGYALMSDPDNAGFSGIRDDQLALIMETGTSSHTGQVAPGPYLDYYPADIILLHIGTNDILASDYSVSDVGRILDAIDDYETSSGNPVLVFLARIISRRGNPCGTDAGVVAFNNNLVAMAQARISSGDQIVLVDMECGAGLNYSTDLIDQLHPNQNGYDKMADKWFEAIDNYNNAPTVLLPNQETDRKTAFTPISLDAYVSDVEDTPEEMTWSFLPSSPVYFDVSIDVNRIATVTPKDTAWSGSETIEFIATDQGKVFTALRKSGSSLTQFTVNWVPEIIGQQPLSTIEDIPLEISIDDLVLVEPEKAPGGLTLQVLPGINYTVLDQTVTPALNFSGQLTVPVKVIDDGKESNTYNLVVDVIPGIIPPVVTDIPDQTIAEGQSFSQINLDSFVSDADHADNTLTWTTTGESNLSVDITDRVATITANDPDWNGNETITFQVEDPDGETDSDQATFTVTPVNDPPVVSDIPNQTVAEGTPFASITLDNYVADVDNADNTITWTATGQSNLNVDITNRVATITALDPEWNGTETITFTAEDPLGLQDSDAIGFQVTAVNDLPVMTDIPDQTIAEGQSFSQINLDTFVSDADHADELQSWTALGQSDINISIVGRIATLTVDPDWNGSETVVFLVEDPLGGQDSDSVKLTVTPVNDPPVVSDISDMEVVENENFLKTLNLNDLATDVDHSDSEITWTIQGDNHIVVNIESRVATITPDDPEWNGSDTLIFTATDPLGASDSDTSIFTVKPVNDVPTLNKAIPDTSADANIAFSLVLDPNTFMDIDQGDSLVYSATISKGGFTPGWITFDPASRTFSGIPADADKGIVEVIVTATDDSSASVADTFNIEVKSYVGIGNQMLDLEIKLYPNPNNGKFVIESDMLDLKDVILEIFNEKGQLVWNRKVKDEMGTLYESVDMSNTSDGLYLLKVRTNSAQINKRFIIAY